MRAVFDDGSLFENNDAIKFSNRRKAMGNNDTRATLHKFVEARLYELFASPPFSVSYGTMLPLSISTRAQSMSFLLVLSYCSCASLPSIIYNCFS